MIRLFKVRPHERGLLWKDGALVEILGPGRHVKWDVLRRYTLEKVNTRDVWLVHKDLDVKDLLNKVTEAKKAAEAALITRREETAAMRSQLNTAKLIESSPTLMRLRELEVLEKVAEKSNLTVVLGEQGLTDRVVKKLL